MRHGRPGLRGDPAALGQMDLEEVAILAVEAAEGVQGLDHAGPLAPTASAPRRQGQHGHFAPRKGRPTKAAATVIGQARLGAVNDVPVRDVFDDRIGRQPVLGQADASRPQIEQDLLVQLGSKPFSSNNRLRVT